MIKKLGILTACLCLFVGAQAGAAAVGKALVVLGQAEKIMVNGAVPLSVGDDIQEKDIVRTLPGAVVQIGLLDGGFIAVRPNSSVSVEKFILDKENPQREKQLTKVFAGSIQAVTGRIGKRLPANVTYATPVATMGIRGTVIDLGISETGQSIARVLVGAAEFATPQGTIPMTKGSAVSVNRGQAPRKNAAAGKSLANTSAAVKAQVVAVVGASPMDVVVDTEKQVETAKTLKKEIQAKLDDATVDDEAKEVLKSELANVDTALSSVEQALDTVKTQLAVDAVSVETATATVDAVKDAFSAIQSTENTLVEKSIIQSNYTESYSDPETSDDALSDDTSSSESAVDSETDTKEEAAAAEAETEKADAESQEAESTTDTKTDQTAAANESGTTDSTSESTTTKETTTSTSSVTRTSTPVTNIAQPTAVRTSKGGSSSTTKTTEEPVEEEVVEEEVVEEEVVEEEVVEEDPMLQEEQTSDRTVDGEATPAEETTEADQGVTDEASQEEVVSPEEDPALVQVEPVVVARLSLRPVEDESASPSK